MNLNFRHIDHTNDARDGITVKLKSERDRDHRLRCDSDGTVEMDFTSLCS